MPTARNIKAVLIDLSGTLHIDSSPIPGAVQALERLRESKVGIRFVTNTTKESKRVLHQRLTNLGFDIDPSEIFTSLTAARCLIDKLQVRPMLMLEDAAMEDFNGVSMDQCNAVVVGLAPNRFDYETMTKAFKLILGGASFIAIHKSRYFQTSEGPALGPGPFVTALEYATDTKAQVVGKPMKDFFLGALEGLGCAANEAIMIGDDVRDDVIGAQTVGMTGILVRTGKYREGDEKKTDPLPNYTFKDFPDATDFILDKLVS